jgi:hypothetical protein
MSYSSRFTRRNFLQGLACAGAAGMMYGVSGRAVAASSYNGKLLVNLQLVGAMDVTSFADPKVNVPGKPIINDWAQTAPAGKAGNIAYASFAANAAFFDKYYQDMLVINGVDAQTNSHTVGVLHNWSGRNTEGFPSLTALFAGASQSGMPMPYLNFGGFGATQGVSTVTQIGKISILQNLVEPDLAESSNKLYIPDADWQRIVAMHSAGLTARSADAATIEGARQQQQAYLDALTRSDAIGNFASLLPTTANLEPTRKAGTVTSSLHQQMQVSLLAFKAGVSLSADVFEPGFDTHQDHDTRLTAALSNVTDAIDYFWTYAASLGIADRIVLVVGSDFGRTPYYNSSDGKDHWPIGSVMVMQQKASFTNRVVGLTDTGHNAIPINPVTLQADSAHGVTLRPEHVHKALRKYLGIDTAAVTQQFPFTTTEDVAIFG